MAFQKGHGPTGVGKFSHIDWDKVFDMYYANTGTYDWRTKQGEVKAWKYTLKQIKARFGLNSDSNILDRVRRYGHSARAVVAPMIGRTAGHGPKKPNRYPPLTSPSPVEGVESHPEQGSEEGGGDGEAARSAHFRKVAANGHVIHATLTSPRGIYAIHGIAREIAKAMGVNCPSPQELAAMLAKMTK
jgi:hypothetical protein